MPEIQLPRFIMPFDLHNLFSPWQNCAILPNLIRITFLHFGQNKPHCSLFLARSPKPRPNSTYLSPTGRRVRSMMTAVKRGGRARHTCMQQLNKRFPTGKHRERASEPSLSREAALTASHTLC